MTNEIQHILDECKLALDDVNDKNLSEFSNVEKGIKISRKYLQQLRVVLRKRNFINNENEILFFKKQKPFIYGQLKFYAKLYKYLLQKPRGTDKSKRNYLDAEIKKLQEYYYYNSEFIKYYRQNATFLDEFYFLRGNDNIGLLSDTSHFYTDAE
ncbi:RteC domain-containing protein, partial [Mesonia sp.]